MVRGGERRTLAAAAMILGCLACCGCRHRSVDDFPPEPSAPPSAATPANPAAARPVQRYCFLISLIPGKVDEFQELHKRIPLPVKEAIHQAGIRNYSVFACVTETQIFAVRYYDYVGKEHEGDMAALARNSAFKTWRNKCEACEVPLDLRPSLGKWWSSSTEVLHLE